MKSAYIKPEVELILMSPLMGNPTASLGDGEAEDFDAKQNDGDLEEIEFDMWK